MKEYEKRKLSFQLVPSTSWYTNLRSILPNWKEISLKVRASGHCDICGKATSSLDAHEVWEYDDVQHTQKLKRVISVCKECHHTIHIGYAQIIGLDKEAFAHYQKVNFLSEQLAEKDLDAAWDDWERRSDFPWKIDVQQIKDTVFAQLGISCEIDDEVNHRYYASVSYDEKDNAKRFGAKWDVERRMWYFTTPEEREDWGFRFSEKERMF